MSIEAHIQRVSQKRALLKKRIAEEMSHASPNFALISDLKKQNLVLKEEMLRHFRQLKTAASA